MFELYREELSKFNELHFIDTNLDKITPWMIDVVFKNKKLRKEIINYLINNNVETRIFYPSLHTLRPYLKNKKNYPVSSDISSKGLWLPSSTSLTKTQILHITKLISNFLS